MDAALEERDLPAAERPVHVGQADVVGAAVVGREEDQRVLLEAVRAERVQHAPDAAVERADHRRVDAQAVVGDLRERVVVLARRLERRVRRPVRQVQEERPIAVGLDHLHGLVGVVVREVARRREGGCRR